ncbi:MAG: hypothetical protein Phog2KO_19330 [Phototrophicaceae bacterium]
MVNNMVHELMSQTDRKSIGQNRQFGSAEMESLPLFANTFRSDMGLAGAFAQLDKRELAFLHILANHDGEVSIDFFKNLYQLLPANRYSLTFTQTYNDLFKQVRKRLIRGGILLWAETGRGDAKLERYRFALPQAIIDKLPDLITETTIIETDKVVSQDGFRERLVQLLKAKTYRDIAIEDGNLMLNRKRFHLNRLEAWQDEQWLQRLRPNRKNTVEVYPYYSAQISDSPFTPPSLIRYGLSQLGENVWVQAQAFKIAFEFINQERYVGLDDIFEIGWQWGCLERVKHGQAYFYRLRHFSKWDDLRITYLKSKRDNLVVIDVETVPYDALSILMTFGDFHIYRNQLQLTPNLAKLSETTKLLRENAIAQWLQTHNSAFADAFEQVSQQWGKLIVHENLLYAQVSDLSLRVTLEKAFDDGSVLFMSNGWLAFPASMVRKIETVVNRSGHVIKEVSTDD